MCYWVRHHKRGFRFKFSFICSSWLVQIWFAQIYYYRVSEYLNNNFYLYKWLGANFITAWEQNWVCHKRKRTFERLNDYLMFAQVLWCEPPVLYILYLISIYIYYINCSIPKTWVVLRSLSIITEAKHIAGFYYFSKCTEQ